MAQGTYWSNATILSGVNEMRRRFIKNMQDAALRDAQTTRNPQLICTAKHTCTSRSEISAEIQERLLNNVGVKEKGV